MSALAQPRLEPVVEGDSPPPRAPLRVAFVYPNPRQSLLDAIALGTAPDSALLGQSHLRELGFAARVHDPVRTATGRWSWYLRELVLPWELDDDVVFTQLFRVLPLAARVRRRSRIVVVNYGVNVLLRHTTMLRRRLVIEALRAAALVVCLGDSQRSELIELAGLDAHHVVTVRLGIDAAFFTPLPATVESTPLVLAVGKDPARDYASLAEALRGLAVDGVLVAHPRALEGVDLPPNVRRCGWLEAAELRELYRRASCVVIPQRRDGYAQGTEGGGLTSLLEAMATGRPVVATHRAVLAEYATDGETAVIVPPEEPEALRMAITMILSDDELAQRLGSAARARVEESYTTRHMAERLAPVLAAAAVPG